MITLTLTDTERDAVLYALSFTGTEIERNGGSTSAAYDELFDKIHDTKETA